MIKKNYLSNREVIRIHIIYQEPFCCVVYLHKYDLRHIEPTSVKEFYRALQLMLLCQNSRMTSHVCYIGYKLFKPKTQFRMNKKLYHFVYATSKYLHERKLIPVSLILSKVDYVND